MGRCGRTHPDEEFRLYTTNSQGQLTEELTGLLTYHSHSKILRLKLLGCKDIWKYDFVGPPPPRLRSLSYGLGQSLASWTAWTRQGILPSWVTKWPRSASKSLWPSPCAIPITGVAPPTWFPLWPCFRPRTSSCPAVTALSRRYGAPEYAPHFQTLMGTP